MVPPNSFVWKMLLSLFIHSCMIWRLRVRVWMDIRFSSSRSPALWDTDTSSSTRAHSYQIYSGMYCKLYKLLPSVLFPSAQCWQNSSATVILIFFIFWVWIQAIFRIVPGGVILTFNKQIWFYLRWRLLVMISLGRQTLHFFSRH